MKSTLCQYIYKTDVKYLIYILLAAYFAVDLQYFHFAVQSQWQLLTVMSLSLLIFGETFGERILLIWITGLLAAGFTFLEDMLLPIYLKALYVSLLVFFSIFVIRTWRITFLSAFIINVFVILVILTPHNLLASSQRSLAIIIGLMVVLILQLIFLPFYRKNLIKDNILQLLNSLQTLNTEIFNCFLKVDYKDNFYLYERRIHIAKKQFWQAYTLLKSRAKYAANMELTLEQYNNVFAALIACAQLRSGVSDPSTFELCKQELQTITNIINAKILAMIASNNCNDKTLIATEDLSFSIARLEELIGSVIQVAAPEPLVFYLFVASLKRYSAALDTLSQYEMVKKKS